jgi:hypothetical protein
MKKYTKGNATACSYVNIADRQRRGGEGIRGGGRRGCKAPAVVVMKSKRNCREDDTDPEYSRRKTLQNETEHLRVCRAWH